MFLNEKKMTVHL